jgi:hypothetical protein
MQLRIMTVSLLVACATNSPPPPDAPARASPPPVVHIHTAVELPDFDAGFCRSSAIPIQDPVFPTIRRDRFAKDADDVVTIPPDWIAEARDTRVPQLRAAAAQRLPVLLGKVQQLVRPFEQRDFDYYFYLCPYFGGGTASAKVYPMFMYLHAAVGELAWPDFLFTDQYLFHEVMHNFVMERVDYSKGTPFLNQLYTQLVADADFTAAWMRYVGDTASTPAAKLQADQAQMVGLVLTHIHVYAIMTVALRALGEEERLQTIRSYETSLPASHPSYVRAWQVVIGLEKDPAALDRVIREVQ